MKADLEFQRTKDGDRMSIGRGAFGNVLVADYFGTKCAYKEIVSSDFSGEDARKFLLELKLIARLRHPNIVQCLGVVWEKDENSDWDRGIMFELCSNGSLDTFMQKHKNLGLTSWRKTAEKRRTQMQAMERLSFKDNEVGEDRGGM